MLKANFVGDNDFITREHYLAILDAVNVKRNWRSNLRKLGFARHEDWENVYIHEKWGVIVKKSYLTTAEIPPKDKVCPTIILSKQFPIYDVFCIQPILEEVDSTAEYDRVSRDYDLRRFDNHWYNMGIYNGRIVLHDW